MDILDNNNIIAVKTSTITVEMVKEFIRSAIDINEKNNAGNTLLHRLASFYGDRDSALTMLSLLSKTNIDFTALNLDNQTPIALAFALGNKTMAHALTAAYLAQELSKLSSLSQEQEREHAIEGLAGAAETISPAYFNTRSIVPTIDARSVLDDNKYTR